MKNLLFYILILGFFIIQFNNKLINTLNQLKHIYYQKFILYKLFKLSLIYKHSNSIHKIKFLLFIHYKNYKEQKLFILIKNLLFSILIFYFNTEKHYYNSLLIYKYSNLKL